MNNTTTTKSVELDARVGYIKKLHIGAEKLNKAIIPMMIQRTIIPPLDSDGRGCPDPVYFSVYNDEGKLIYMSNDLILSDGDINDIVSGKNKIDDEVLFTPSAPVEIPNVPVPTPPIVDGETPGIDEIPDEPEKEDVIIGGGDVIIQKEPIKIIIDPVDPDDDEVEEDGWIILPVVLPAHPGGGGNGGGSGSGARRYGGSINLTNVDYRHENNEYMVKHNMRYPKAISAVGCFRGDNADEAPKFSCFDFGADFPVLKNASYMFQNCPNIVNASTILDCMPRISSAKGMFAGCQKLESAHLQSRFLGNCNSMFAGCPNIKSVSLNIPNVSDAAHMFQNCKFDLQTTISIISYFNNLSKGSMIVYDEKTGVQKSGGINIGSAAPIGDIVKAVGATKAEEAVANNSNNGGGSSGGSSDGEGNAVATVAATSGQNGASSSTPSGAASGGKIFHSFSSPEHLKQRIETEVASNKVPDYYFPGKWDFIIH